MSSQVKLLAPEVVRHLVRCLNNSHHHDTVSLDTCDPDEFDCGQGVCTDPCGRCDDIVDCHVSRLDEVRCPSKYRLLFKQSTG